MDWGPIIRGKLLEHMLAIFEAGAAFVRAGQEAGVLVEGDPKHLMLTALGLHCIPFSLAQLTERYVGQSPFDPAFLEERRVAVRKQMRKLFVKAE
jgi:hypothetical protein